MLRIYFLQQWYALSDPLAEEMLVGQGGLLTWFKMDGKPPAEQTDRNHSCIE